MTRVAMVGSALSQLGNVITAFDLKETGPNESFSARMHRQKRSREKLITQSKLTAAYVKAVADDGFQITAWKTGPGVFSTLTAASIIAAANAIEAHVQACFDNEASLSGEITDAADLAELAAVDIEGGW